MANGIPEPTLLSLMEVEVQRQTGGWGVGDDTYSEVCEER
jgi:hypothetical protein